MKNTIFALGSLALAGLAFAACSNDDNGKSEKQLVMENYANIVYQNYKDALTDAEELEVAINTFTANPNQDSFDNAKTKWKEARETYGTTEAFRFANGPIDVDDNGPEALLNAWPLDENFIDYVEDNGTVYNGGIINRTDLYPTITKELLETLNESGGEKTISVGYHAIEFLLWGQDLTVPSAFLAGQRPYTDYTTALNAERRKQYLNICADLLTDHLTYLVDLWAPSGTYRATFLGMNENVALTNMYLGIATLAAAELPIERMSVALNNRDQEDEHSCFSDNTHRDIIQNLQGIINVYHGKYRDIEGASLAGLVKKANPEFYNNIEASIVNAQTKVNAVYIPFDYAISGGASSVEGAKVADAWKAIKNDLSVNLLSGSSALGLAVNP